MPRNKSSSTGRRHFAHKALSKSMLLPLPAKVAAEISLANHLALAVCKRGEGNDHLLNELLRIVHVGYFLEQAATGDVAGGLYKEAKFGLEAALKTGHLEMTWRVDAALGSILEQVLARFDGRLENAATLIHLDARNRLDRFIAGENQSLFADPPRSLGTPAV
jgi:hypothetical protein